MAKLALVSTELAPLEVASGALERVVLAWTDGLREAALEVETFDASGPGGLPVGAISRFDPDLVVLNNRPLWAERLGRPSLHLLHNYPDAWGPGSEDEAAVRRALSAGRVAAVSASLAGHIERRYRLARPVEVVAVAVEECFFEVSWEGVGGPVLFPNRVLEKKGVRFFLELADHLAASGRETVAFCHLAPFASPTPEQVRLVELMRSHATLRLLDPPATRAEMASSYAQAGVVVCPSVAPEGLGLVALEAQAVGAPLVTSGRGGLADSTFPPNEIVADLALEPWLKAIERAYEHDGAPAARAAVEAAHRGRQARSSLAAVVAPLLSATGAPARREAPGSLEVGADPVERV